MQITHNGVCRTIWLCSLGAAQVVVLHTHSLLILWGRRIKGRRGRFLVQVDMVEIYNEELRDLLAPINAKQKKQHSLQIKVWSNKTLTNIYTLMYIDIFVYTSVYQSGMHIHIDIYSQSGMHIHMNLYFS